MSGARRRSSSWSAKRSSCSGAVAASLACARSTKKRHRAFTSTRSAVSIIALAATRRATRSSSCKRPKGSTSSNRFARWPNAPASTSSKTSPTRSASSRPKRKRRQQELYDLNDRAAEYFERMLREHPLSEHARAELERRGLAPASPTDEMADALQAFRLGYAPYGWDGLVRFLKESGLSARAAETVGVLVPRKTGSGHYDRFRHRLMFAVIDVQGRVVAFSGRALAEPSSRRARAAGIESMGSGGTGEAPAKYVNSPESPIYKQTRNGVRLVPSAAGAARRRSVPGRRRQFRRGQPARARHHATSSRRSVPPSRWSKPNRSAASPATWC